MRSGADSLTGQDRDVITLWRPVGPVELELLRKGGMRAFPPRLPEQPIFYPVLSEDYAVKIARDWNVPAAAPATSLALKSVGTSWKITASKKPAAPRIWNTIPAEEMTAFNEAIVGEIKIVAEFADAARFSLWRLPPVRAKRNNSSRSQQVRIAPVRPMRRGACLSNHPPSASRRITSSSCSRLR